MHHVRREPGSRATQGVRTAGGAHREGHGRRAHSRSKLDSFPSLPSRGVVMPFTTLARPTAEEHAPYYGRYIALVKSADAVEALITQIDDTSSLLERVDEQRAASRYAPGKWSVKQVVGHLVDAERVFAYRAMRFARADQTELP